MKRHLKYTIIIASLHAADTKEMKSSGMMMEKDQMNMDKAEMMVKKGQMMMEKGEMMVKACQPPRQGRDHGLRLSKPSRTLLVLQGALHGVSWETV